MLLGIVEDFPCGGVRNTQGLLHTANGAEHVGFVDHLASAHTYEDVLAVIGHAHNLVGNHLSDGENQVISSVDELFIDLHLNVRGIQPSGNFLDDFLRHFSDGNGVCLPVVY